MLIDTHCHLNDKKAFPDPQRIVQEAVQEGIERLVVIGVDLKSSEYALELAERFKEVFAVVGWHPSEAKEYFSQALFEFEDFLKHPKAIGIGEIGLDFYREQDTIDLQMKCLQEQLDLAVSVQAPVVFHCREAYSDLLRITPKYQIYKKVLHCYGGGEKYLDRAIEQDFYFGIDGPITYPSAKELRECLVKMPEDRILIETDAPWLPPQSYRGQANYPRYLNEIADKVCELKNNENFKEQLKENSLNFFKW